MTDLRGRGQGSLALLVAIILWGLAPVVTRFVLFTTPPGDVLLLRFAIGMIPLGAFLLVKRKRVRRESRDWWILLLTAALGGVGYYLPVTLGLQRVSAGTASLVLATEPVLILLFAALFLGERVKPRVLAGFFVALLGVAGLFLAAGTGFGGSLWGMTLIFLSGVAFSLYSVGVKRLSKAFSAVEVTAAIGAFGFVFLFVPFLGVTLRTVGQLSSSAWLSILYLGLLSTAGGTVLWSVGLARMEASRAGFSLNLLPVVSVLGGVFFLGEPLGVGTMVSGLLVLVGAVIAGGRRLPGGRAQDQETIVMGTPDEIVDRSVRESRPKEGQAGNHRGSAGPHRPG